MADAQSNNDTPNDSEEELGRVYRHRECGGETTIAGVGYSYVSHPFVVGRKRSFCAGCQKYIPYSQLEWVDTGETISAYHQRMREQAPMLLRLLSSVFGLSLLAIIGFLLGWLLAPGGLTSWWPYVGALVGAAIHWLILVDGMPSWFFGIDYRKIR
jgi:hypothetical protein